MAPISFDEIQTLKRSSLEAGLDEPEYPSQKRISFSRHHSLHWRPQATDLAAAVCPHYTAIQSLLSRSIALALDVVGFKHAEPVAIESFRADVQAYMAHFLTAVKQSMLSSRRTQPIAQDFLNALNKSQLTLRALVPHLDPPVDPLQSQVSLAIGSPDETDIPMQSQLIGTLLNDDHKNTTRAYIPHNLPSLPSYHTFRAQPVFTEREQDPRKIRENATEEGRLGEEALRRLVKQDAEQRLPTNVSTTTKKKSFKLQGRSIWAQAMEAVSGNAENTMGPPVNAERVYWRQNITKRPMAMVQGDQAQVTNSKSSVTTSW